MSASDGSSGDESGRAALARVGFAGSFFECLAGSRSGRFAMAPIWVESEAKESTARPLDAGQKRCTIQVCHELFPRFWFGPAKLLGCLLRQLRRSSAFQLADLQNSKLVNASLLAIKLWRWQSSTIVHLLHSIFGSDPTNPNGLVTSAHCRSIRLPAPKHYCQHLFET